MVATLYILWLPHTIDTVPRYRVANSSCLSRCSRLSLRRRSNSSSPFIAFTPAALCQFQKKNNGGKNSHTHTNQKLGMLGRVEKETALLFLLFFFQMYLQQANQKDMIFNVIDVLSQPPTEMLDFLYSKRKKINSCCLKYSMIFTL